MTEETIRAIILKNLTGGDGVEKVTKAMLEQHEAEMDKVLSVLNNLTESCSIHNSNYYSTINIDEATDLLTLFKNRNK